MSNLLKPVPMTKIAVLGLKKFQSDIISILDEMRVVQIEPLSQNANSVLITEREITSHSEISDQLLRIKGLLSVIPPTTITGKSKFHSSEELFRKIDTANIDHKISQLEKQKESLLTSIKECEDNIRLMKEFSFFPEDLQILHLSSARSYFARIDSDRYSEFQKAIDSHKNEIIVYTNQTSEEKIRPKGIGLKKGKKGIRKTQMILVVLPSFSSNKLATIVNSNGVTLEAIPKLEGNPSEIIKNQQKIHRDLNKKLNEINEELSEISRTHYTFLKGAEEYLEIENKKLDVIGGLGVTKDTFALEGWIPKSRIRELKNAFDKHSEGTVIYELDSHKENPPTLFANPKRFKIFEPFIRFYSLPSGLEFDPTLLFGFFFPIFYGMMIGDVGYGLVILFVSLWVIRRVEGGKKDFTIMPKFLRNFAKTILKPVQMVKLAKVIIPGCIITIILGFCFNLYFGFHVNQYLFSFLNDTFGFNLPEDGQLFDPIGTYGLRKLLLISGYIGLGMVSFGLILGILNGLREKAKKHVISKLGWLLFGWGIAMMGLALIGHKDINPTSSIEGMAYFGLLFGGIGLMFYGEGARAMMELPSIISHILSYTRIIGILLASIILADVIDHIFIRTIDNPLPQAVLGIIILFIGHIFNIIIGVFEPGIQGARLIYVEFFSKFYHGNGKPFLPFGSKRRFTYDTHDVKTNTS